MCHKRANVPERNHVHESIGGLRHSSNAAKPKWIILAVATCDIKQNYYRPFHRSTGFFSATPRCANAPTYRIKLTKQIHYNFTTHYGLFCFLIIMNSYYLAYFSCASSTCACALNATAGYAFQLQNNILIIINGHCWLVCGAACANLIRSN